MARRTGTPLRQVRFPNAARDVSTRVHFQCRLSYNVPTPTCAIACINVCAHVKDPVVHVRVRWIVETLKHPACSVGWAARLRRSWRSRGRQPEFPIGEIPLGQYSCKKREKSCCFLSLKKKLRSSGHSHVRSLFNNEEQGKLG